MELVFLVFAFVCFFLSVWTITIPNWYRLIGAGLAFWVASQFIPKLL